MYYLGSEGDLPAPFVITDLKTVKCRTVRKILILEESFMRLRPYIKSKDFKYIAGWIDNERNHALWCANNFPYPVTEEAFHNFLNKTMEEWTVSAFVATDDSGYTIGFFSLFSKY